MLDNHANINYLALSGPPKIEPEYLETTYPSDQIPCTHRYSEVFLTWAKRHIVGLQSLKYDLSCHRIILDVFKICSDTPENLHLCFHRQGIPFQSLKMFFLIRSINLRSVGEVQYPLYLRIYRFKFKSFHEMLQIDNCRAISTNQPQRVPPYLLPVRCSTMLNTWVF